MEIRVDFNKEEDRTQVCVLLSGTADDLGKTIPIILETGAGMVGGVLVASRTRTSGESVENIIDKLLNFLDTPKR